MVLSSLCSDQWKLSLELRRGWDEWVVLVWSASLPSLSLSLYLVLRIFLSFFYLLMVQQTLFRSSHYLLKLSWVQTDNLIPCPCVQKGGSESAWTPCWEWWCSWSNNYTKEGIWFSFRLHSSYISISQRNLHHSFYTCQSKQIFQFKWF